MPWDIIAPASDGYTLCLKKTGPLRLIWQLHQFTFSNYFCRQRPYSILNWCDKKFFFINWLRTSCVVSITTVATWHIRTANFWADFEQCVIDRAINECENDCGLVSRPKDCSSNTCNFRHHTSFRQKHCLFNRFNFSAYKATSTVEWRVVRIAIVTASADRVL